MVSARLFVAPPGGLRRWFGLLVLAVGAVVWVGTAANAGRELRDVPVALVGPDVVTAPLVERMGHGQAAGLLLVGQPDRREAARDLDRGVVAAVVELDLSGTRDRLLLPSDAPAPRRDRLMDAVDAIEASYGRQVRAEGAGGSRGLGSWTPSAGPRLALAAVGLGFLGALVISALRGPVAPSFAAGARRFAALALLAFAVAGALYVGRSPGSGVAAGALACLGAGLVTLASEVVGGVRALVAAAALLLVVPLPLVVVGDRWLLAQPWRSCADWTLVGAATTLMDSHSGGVLEKRALLVLIGVPVLALALLLGWRWATVRNPAIALAGPVQGSPAASDARAVRRRLLGVAVGISGFVLMVYAGWSALVPSESRAAVASLASTTECVQTGSIASLHDLNRIAQLRGSPAMRGGDVGASARLQDGRMLWMFGDTLRDAQVEGGGFVRNSMLLVVPGCLEVVLPESGGAIIPDRRDGVGYWPMSVLVSHHPGYDIVGVTAQRVRTVDDQSVFGFEVLGPAVATYIVPAGATPQLISQHDIGEDVVDTTKPMWGAATAAHDGWAYLYGTARPVKVRPGSGFSLSVARARVDDVGDSSQWRYWDGSGWSSRPSAAAKVIPSRDGVSQTLSVFASNGRWYAVSKRNDVLGRDIVVWTAPAPTGPFTASPPVATVASDAATGTLRYMPLAHPDLLPRAGTVVVSYSENRTDAAEVFADPRLYRPRFLRVRLPRE